MSDQVTEVSKAIQKGWDFGEKALDVVKQAGHYIDRVLGPSFDNLAEIGRDRTALWKLRNFISVSEKAERILKEKGLDQHIKPISERLGIPLIETISKESDPSLQDLWARYLSKGLSVPGGGFITRHLTNIIGSLEPEDAHLLDTLFSKRSQASTESTEIELELMAQEVGLPQDVTLSSLDRLSVLGVFDRDPYLGYVMWTSGDTGHPKEYPIVIKAPTAEYTSTQLLEQLNSALSI